MKKVIIYILVCILIVIFGIVAGWMIYNVTMVGNEKIASKNTQKNIIEETDNNNKIENNIKVVDVSATQEKITPNTKLNLKTYYKDCGHSTKQEIELPSDMINMTKEDLIKQFKQWEVSNFSTKEVILQREEEGICTEHYILKDENGYIAIFWLDSNRNTTLREVTDITTEYLPEFDKQNLKKGIEICGKDSLYMTLEDYE